MRTRTTVAILIALVAPLVAERSSAADDPTAVLKDLTAVIALQGQPCGQAVAATKQADNDYIVACKDGSRYRVFIKAEGRVVVQKQ